jgi:hypothetical protein
MALPALSRIRQEKRNVTILILTISRNPHLLLDRTRSDESATISNSFAALSCLLGGALQVTKAKLQKFLPCATKKGSSLAGLKGWQGALTCL